MAIVAADIIIYGAAAMPENDTADPVGGAIDKTIKILSLDMSDVGGTDALDVVSDNAGDTTQTVTITGRLASGVIDTEVYTLAGTTPQTGTVQFERVLKIVVSATYLGILTVEDNSGNVTLGTLEGTVTAPGGAAVLELRRPFYAALAEDSGGSAVTLYEKVFVANTHATLALLAANIELTFDGTSSLVDFDLEDARNDTNNTGGNRTAEPAGAGMLGAPTWADSILAVPGTDLEDISSGNDHIGVWMRLSMAAGQAPENTNLTFNITGSSV